MCLLDEIPNLKGGAKLVFEWAQTFLLQKVRYIHVAPKNKIHNYFSKLNLTIFETVDGSTNIQLYLVGTKEVYMV